MYDNSTFEEVVLLLRQGGRYSTKELSIKFGVTQKTIQNYMKELREKSGLVKDKTKYYYPDEFRNVDIHERVQMSTALMIALYRQSIPELKESVLSNFKALPKEHNAFLFDINFEEIENEILFNQLVSAVINNKAVSFDYTNKNNILSQKNVYPLKVTNMLGYWYVLGYDLEDEKIKSFYIKSICKLSLFEESFLTEQEIKALSYSTSEIESPWFSEDSKSVLLEITGDAMLYLKRKTDATLNIVKESDDHILAKMQYYNDTEILVFVKKWLPFITIKDNEPLKQKLQNILTASLKNYS